MTACFFASAWCATTPCTPTDCWATEMPEVTDELDRRIAAAMAALHGARAAAWHSPSAANLTIEARREQALNDLLDERLARKQKVSA